MSGSIQLINISPEQLLDEVEKRFETKIQTLQKHYQPKEPEELLTRIEAADLLKISISSLKTYTKKGILISYGLNGRVYYKRSEVEAALIQLNN